MDKIIQWLTGGVIKEVGGVIDKLTTTKEEKLEAKRLMVEILEKAKNIRPMVLIYLTVIFTVCAFFDGNVGQFKIAEEYIPIFQTLLVTVYGAYFVGRSWEKAKKIQSNN